MSAQVTSWEHNRQPHYSFMRPMDFGFFVFLLIFDAGLIASFWQWSDTHAGQRLLMSATLLGPTLGYAWMRYSRRNLCADSGELVLSIIIPQIAFQIYSQIHDPQMARALPVLCFAFLAPFVARNVWRAPDVARRLEEALAVARDAEADPRFTHVENS